MPRKPRATVAVSDPAPAPRPEAFTVGGRRYVPAAPLTYRQYRAAMQYGLEAGLLDITFSGEGDAEKASRIQALYGTPAALSLAACVYVAEGETWTPEGVAATVAAWAAVTEFAEFAALDAAVLQGIVDFFRLVRGWSASSATVSPPPANGSAEPSASPAAPETP